MYDVEKRLTNPPKSGVKWGSLKWGSVNHNFLLDRDKITAISVCGMPALQSSIQYNADAPNCKRCTRIIQLHNRKRS